jgi:predicted ATPase
VRLTTVFVRFYKSFNYDYERRAHFDAKRRPWEILEDGAWYPFVRVPLESDITTIVGANEAGKSHLLDAIELSVSGSIASTGKGTTERDFCRYSDYFSVEEGSMRLADFGGEFEIADAADVDAVQKAFERDVRVGMRFKLFRLNGATPVFYWTEDAEPIALKPTQLAMIEARFPSVFRLDARTPLPDGIGLFELSDKVRRPWHTRRERNAFIDEFARDWENKEAIAKAAPEIWGRITKLLSSADKEREDEMEAQRNLARKLLFDVSNVSTKAIDRLDEALADEAEGFVNATIDEINAAIARHLNLNRWWSQDKDFALVVSPREHDLGFTIRDRTGSDYSFRERSAGLRYFLSYLVQLRAHHPPVGRPEILLMDEPDAFLSSQGQQDLLRILEAFTQPDSGSRRDQVAYVTHSPFFIDRNAASRIRVLDKGVADEGTRVVKDAAKMHYEPLRSALGPFVAETAFIGGANLFVEGPSDQVLIAGLSSHLRAHGTARSEVLDLNSVTVVAAGGASLIPYMVFLARGRDEVQPPCVALLDGDSSGKDAYRTLTRKGGPRAKQILPPEYVVDLGKWAKSRNLRLPTGIDAAEPEDLMPLTVAAAAGRGFADRVLGLEMPQVASFTADEIEKSLADDGSVWCATESAFKRIFGNQMTIDKVAFAKEVVALVVEPDGSVPAGDIAALERRFGALLSHLARTLRVAQLQEENKRLGNRMGRAISKFLDTYTEPATRDKGRIFLEEVELAVGDTAEGDAVIAAIAGLRRDFGLDRDLNSPIDDFPAFRARVAALPLAPRMAQQERAMPIAGEVPPRVESATVSRVEHGEAKIVSPSGRAGSPFEEQQTNGT